MGPDSKYDAVIVRFFIFQRLAEHVCRVLGTACAYRTKGQADLHIPVVDDIEVNRIILVKILSTLGAKCDTASNGQEAVEKFMGASYDLIMMDVQMPEMNGYEATRAIRASSHPFAKAIPNIAMAANAFVDDVRDAIDSGMDAHIAKPVQIGNLKTTIQQVLDSRAAENP